MNDYDLAVAISTIIRGYREDEVSHPLDVAHVQRWVNQFDQEDRHTILQETFQILLEQYYSREKIKNILKRFLGDMGEYIGSFDKVVFTSTQERGSSQTVLYSMVKEILGDQIQLQSDNFIDPKKKYVYIDDGVYTGGRLWEDISRLILRLPPNCTLWVYHIYVYSDAYFRVKIKLRKFARKKNILLKFGRSVIYYNERNTRAKTIDFVWPDAEIQSDEMVSRYEGELQTTGRATGLYYDHLQYENEKGMFSSFQAEKVVSSAFLKAGLKICNQLSKMTFRPLGFTDSANFGFGSFAVTAFNISNTAPLVLWWGSLENNAHGPIGCWYPLLPRRNNRQLYQYVEERERRLSIVSLRPILKTVYRLAVDDYNAERARNHQQNLQRSSMGITYLFDYLDLEEIQDNLEEIQDARKQSKLFNYLLGRDYDELQAIETTMYIGREYEANLISESECLFDEEGRCNLAFRYPVENPDMVLYEWMNSLDEARGWQSKFIEANTVYQKRGLLYQYMAKGLEILGIR